MLQKYTLGQLAKELKAKSIGDENIIIKDVRSINEAETGDITFIKTEKYLERIKNSKASAFIVRENHQSHIKNGLVVKNPRIAAANIINLLNPKEDFKPFKAATAYISPEARIAENTQIHHAAYIAKNVQIKNGVIIHPGVYIGENVIIDEDTEIMAGVVVYPNCKIGKNVIINSNASIGTDGWGFEIEENLTIHKIPHKKGVIIEDDVEIGSNSTIESGTFKTTIIGKSTKLSSNVHIGHNSKIGPKNFFGVFSATAGSSITGEFVCIMASSGVIESLKIADKTFLAPNSIIIKDTEPGANLAGYPAEPKMEWLKKNVLVSKLPKMFEQIKKLESELQKAKQEIETLKNMR